MKNAFFALICFFILLLGNCDWNDAGVEVTQQADILSPAIWIDGRQKDTAYLFGAYRDPGAVVVDQKTGRQNCREFLSVSDITGAVDTRRLGTYFLTYHAQDASGNVLSAVTRTVEVVENRAGFMNGSYDVAYTCTVTMPGSPNATLSTGNYSAVVSTGEMNGRFELNSLKVGPDFIIPAASLDGSSIEISLFGRDYDARSSAAGILSPDKNTFTIESRLYPYFPAFFYHYKTVFTRRLKVSSKGDSLAQ